MEVSTRYARLRLVLGMLTIGAAGFGFGTAVAKIANALSF